MLFDAANYFLVHKIRVVKCEPWLPQILLELLCVECKLEKVVHFHVILALNQLFVVLNRQLIKPEKREVSEDTNQDGFRAVNAADSFLVLSCEQAQKLLVTDAAVEDLLDEHNFVGSVDLRGSKSH